MILYQLVCEHEHTFDAWFRDSAAFDALAAAGALTCSVCGTASVSKALMAPRLGHRKGASPAAAPAEAGTAVPVTDTPQPAASQAAAFTVPAGLPSEMVERVNAVMRELRAHVTATCEDVGTGFAEEARKIHYGEAEVRGIYGETTPEEAESLQDEGISFFALPTPRHDS